MNSEWRVSSDDELAVGTEVFAYYLSGSPSVAVGRVTERCADGWHYVEVDDRRFCFNAERLAVRR